MSPGGRPSDAPVVRGSRRGVAIALALIGAFIALATQSAPARQGPPAEHGAAIAVNIAGVPLSVHISFH